MAAACVAAFVAGLVDAIAGGGGLITLPVMLSLGLPPHVALGTNKGQSVFGTATSLATFWRRGGIDTGRVPAAFLAGLFGSALGALALLAVQPEPLRPLVVVLLIGAVAVVLGRPYIQSRIGAGTAAGGGAPLPAVPARAIGLATAIIGFTLGAYDGFFGPGTGSMLIIAFTVVLGDSLTRASGNAKVVNLASNLAAVAVFSWRGTIAWSIALPMAAANIVGASVGTRLVLRQGDRFVRAVILIVVSAAVVKISLDLRR
jgi:uncharacterized membrane protein YfcA